MFIDVAEVIVKAGDGGNGVVSFRHEKFVDRGGPDGGDGGDGGNVVFLATNNINALQSFRHKQTLAAKGGGSGKKQRQNGRSGEDLIVKVPIGTAVYLDETEELVADLAEDGQQATIASGGKGGFGNAHFKSSTRQAPKVAEKGETGEKFELRLELKLLADVGLVGLPNAGKSTFLSVVSQAKPKIADYPFTTLSPNLGVADLMGSSLLIADIPGLIEGASDGKGLGDEFLRHIERTAVLLHLIDAYSDDVADDFNKINNELSNYKVDLSQKPQIIVLTKIDGLDEEIVAEQKAKLKKATKQPIQAISSKSSQGIDELLKAAMKLVDQQRQLAGEVEEEVETDYELVTVDDNEAWKVSQVDGKFKVRGKQIEKFASKTDFGNEFGVQRLKHIMKKQGITHELTRQGAKSGDVIEVGKERLEM